MKMQQLAESVAYSPVFSKARKLWDLNQNDWNLPLSKLDKLLVGTQLILRDYAKGLFPPTFEDQQKAYDAEIAYKYSLPGFSAANVTDTLMRKPFWFGKPLKEYLAGFVELAAALEQLEVKPPQTLLELGCGSGWMSEFLAQMRFDVVGTTISPHEIEDAQLRVQSLEAKRLEAKLDFRAAPMESVDQAVRDRIPFDAVFVFEALHHVYDWRQALRASYACLKPGGWLIIANEPNILHTFVSYRVAKISNTHEIGFTRGALVRRLKQTGFRDVRVLKNALGLYLRPHWIAAQK